MTVGTIVQALAPECTLLIGACVVLVLGVTGQPLRARWVPWFTLVTVLAALLWTLGWGTANHGEVVPGLWLTSLTHYTRCITLVVGAFIVLVNWRQSAPAEHGEYMGLILFSMLGVLLTASANDLIVLFFAIELVSVPTYVLIALSRTDARASEAAVKYFFLGALSAAILAFGFSYLYGAMGTTTIHRFIGGAAESNVSMVRPMGAHMVIGLLLVFGGLAFKIAAVPLHVYAADVYEGAAAPIAGLLGFVPKAAGFVALCKVLGACDWNLPIEVRWVIWFVAAATMTVGNVLGLLQKNVKRMLAYSSIAHTGYMLVALLVGPVAGQGPMRDGVAALLFYIAVYGVMNLGAFACLSAFQSGEREVETLDDLGGLARRAPGATLGLAICVFSLMGFPPTAGFFGKLYVFSSAFALRPSHPLHDALIVLVIIGVANSVVAAAYYLRIVAAAYWGREVDPVVPAGGSPVRWGLALCSLPLLLLFVWPSSLTDEASSATTDLRRAIRPSYARLTSSVGSVDPSPPVPGASPEINPPDGPGNLVAPRSSTHDADSDP